MRTADFILKWKLFKLLLESKGAPYTLLVPTNQKEVDQSVKIILETRGKNRELLRGKESLELPSWSLYEPPLHEDDNGWESRGSV